MAILAPQLEPPASELGASKLGSRPFRFIDLFAGIGGIRMALERADGACVYSVEIDRFARHTYEANFGLCEGEDIHHVRGSDLPVYDVLAAGFPCQPFSIAGVSKKLSLGRSHGFDDEKSVAREEELHRERRLVAPDGFEKIAREGGIGCKWGASRRLRSIGCILRRNRRLPIRSRHE